MAIIQASRTQITAAEARAAWDYDVETGDFRWKARSSKCVRLGGIAGASTSNGYTRLRLNGVEYLSKTLGRFNTAEEAHQVYLNAKRIHHAGCTL